MADYHFVYKDLEGASTQWDDIQRKLGNLPPKPAPFKPAPFAPAEDEDSKPKGKDWLDEKTEEELQDLEDDLDDDRFLEEYRKKRLAEIRESAKIARFGSVIPYIHSYPECRLLLQCLEDLSKRYHATKFVKIISTECIPNYPDRNLPTILVYYNGAVKATHVGIQSFGRRCTPESMSFLSLPLFDKPVRAKMGEDRAELDPVLNDGQGGEQSRDAVLAGVRKKFVERAVKDHEDGDDDGSSSD
ncbi:phosducin-like protein [Striga asiatica]|uniref:Phosducin-like protein n=1 Tax=Striga asiatica TaxID=4170 RepID=A0A5A7PLQ8_STRAF|nr:phosducin-like protein [Striga asiatica]